MNSNGATPGELTGALKEQVRHVIGPIATPDQIMIVPGLPKTRSGKIMRRGGNRLHKSEHRPTRVMKRRETDQEVSKADADRLKRLLS